MYALYGHARYYKFKGKYQQYGPRFHTILPFLMTMIKVKKLETKIFLIDDKNYKDLTIYFAR